MKVLINNIGKKIHTLVKENTPCCHKIRQECGFTQKASFFSVLLCFLPTVMQILVGRLDSYLLTHTKKYMTPIHALKSRCKFVMLLGKYAQQKQVGWEVIFSELGFAGSWAHKPRRKLEGSTLDFSCSFF